MVRGGGLALVAALLALSSALGAGVQVVHDATAPLLPGDRLQVVVVGEPGGKASFGWDLETVRGRLSEVAAGVYAGSYTVDRRDRVNGRKLIGWVTVGDQRDRGWSAGRVGRPAPAVKTPLQPVITRSSVAGPRITVDGSRDGRAWLVTTADVGDAAANELSPTTPGSYTGTSDRAQAAADEGRALALLQSGDAWLAVRAAGAGTADTTPPTVSVLSPRANRIQPENPPLVAVSFADHPGGGGIDRATARVTLDAVDVTADAYWAGGLLLYRSVFPLAIGRHTVHVEIADPAGNRGSRDWSFRSASVRYPVIPRPISPANCSLAVDQPVADVKEQIGLTLTIRDRAGWPIAGVPVQAVRFLVEGQELFINPLEGVSDGRGQVKTSVMGFRAGEGEAKAYVVNEEVPGKVTFRFQEPPEEAATN